MAGTTGGALGRYGEALVERRLAGGGWRVLARNWRSPWPEVPGELDLVAIEPAGALVVVEVKTRRRVGTALAAVGPDKVRRLRRLAGVWCATDGRRTGAGGRALRLDVVTVELRAGGPPQLEHVVGAG